MSDKKTNFRRVLATVCCGAALAAALFLMAAADKKAKHEMLCELADVMPTKLVRDTVNVCIDKNGYVIADDGQYNVFKDVVTRHHFRDTSGTYIGQYAANMINENTKFNDYHEVRHAFNTRLMMHYKGAITPDVEAADEISARVASCLAAFGQMSPLLKPGILSSRISYRLHNSYDMQRVIDASFIYALSKLYENDKKYRDNYHMNSELVSQQLPVMNPGINKKTLINEIMTFEINGKSENLLKLASKDVRKRVYDYINRDR